MIEKDTCPVCDAHFKYAAAVSGDAQIKPDDISVCASCTSYLVYEEGNTYRLMTVDEIVDLDNELLYELTSARNTIKRRAKQHDQQMLVGDLLDNLFGPDEDE